LIANTTTNYALQQSRKNNKSRDRSQVSEILDLTKAIDSDIQRDIRDGRIEATSNMNLVNKKNCFLNLQKQK